MNADLGVAELKEDRHLRGAEGRPPQLDDDDLGMLTPTGSAAAAALGARQIVTLSRSIDVVALTTAVTSVPDGAVGQSFTFLGLGEGACAVGPGFPAPSVRSANYWTKWYSPMKKERE